MNQPTPAAHDDVDVVMRRLLAEAGDPRVEPRPEFVASLRSRVLEKVGPEPARRSWKSQVRLLAGTAPRWWRSSAR